MSRRVLLVCVLLLLASPSYAQTIPTCAQLTNDACLGGRSGGQTLNGGTAASNALTLRGSAGATQPLSAILLNDTAKGRVIIGNTSGTGWLDVTVPAITGTGTVASSGTIVTLTQSGGQPLWNTSGNAGQLHVGDILTSGGISVIVTAVLSNTSVSVDNAPLPAWSASNYTFSPPVVHMMRSGGTALSFTADGRFGVGTSIPDALINIAGPATPPSSSSGNGFNAIGPLHIVAGIAGDTSSPGATGGISAPSTLSTAAGGANTATANAGNAGGAGGEFDFQMGPGGAVSDCGSGCTPGAGGALIFSGGVGGDISAGTGGSTAGAGSTITFDAGAGGNAVAGNTNGPGGNMILEAGPAGAGAGAAGTKGQVRLGIANASPVNVGTGGLRIGDTTNATQYLDVAGKFLVTSTGNVRVGDSTAPRTQLDVQGGISSMNTATAPDKSFTFPTLQRIDFTTRRRLTGATTRGTLQGTAQWRGRDENKNLTLPLITATYGDANFTLPTLHQRRFYTRFALTRATRGTLQGSANLRGQDENKNVTLPQITVTRPDVSFTLATLNQRRFTTSLYLTGGTRGTLQGSANLRGQSEGKNIITMAVSPGSLTVASGEFRQYARRQYLQGNARIVLQGSGFLCGMRS